MLLKGIQLLSTYYKKSTVWPLYKSKNRWKNRKSDAGDSLWASVICGSSAAWLSNKQNCWVLIFQPLWTTCHSVDWWRPGNYKRSNQPPACCNLSTADTSSKTMHLPLNRKTSPTLSFTARLIRTAQVQAAAVHLSERVSSIRPHLSKLDLERLSALIKVTGNYRSYNCRNPGNSSHLISDIYFHILPISSGTSLSHLIRSHNSFPTASFHHCLLGLLLHFHLRLALSESSIGQTSFELKLSVIPLDLDFKTSILLFFLCFKSVSASNPASKKWGFLCFCPSFSVTAYLLYFTFSRRITGEHQVVHLYIQ